MALPTVEELVCLFKRVNKDCEGTEESIVTLNDIDYYSDQIANIFGLESDVAHKLAEDMSLLT